MGGVDLDRNLLVISSKRELRKEEKEKDYLGQERQEGRFLRTIRLPVAVPEIKMEAAYTNSVLTIRLPKAQETAKVTIK